MHSDPLTQDPDEFDPIDDLHDELYVHGLQMAAMLGAQLRGELEAQPDENALKKWYTWTRGLNQLESFRYSPLRHARKEQKQRGRPPQQPKIHLNGPAPQLRKPATPKPETPPESPASPSGSAEPTATESANFTKPAVAPLSPAKPMKFDPINQHSEKAPGSPLTSLTPTEFDRLYTNLRQGPRTYVEGPCSAL